MSFVKATGESEQTLPQVTPLITDECFSIGYEKGFPLTVRFLLARGLSYELALETAQAAWTKGWEKRAQLRQPALLLTWTNTIALNIYRTSLRRELQNETLPPPATSVSLDVSAIDVERILTQCKPNDGKIIRKHYIDGYKPQEIAHLYGCTETAIRIRLYRARRKLQHQVLKPLSRSRL
jgi:RNA polymerase sigma factor (sigma-70 family)